MRRGVVYLGALLAVASLCHAQSLGGLVAPKPSGKCDCRKKGGIPAKGPAVCGADFTTYGNECVAKCENVLIYSKKGACPKCNLKCGNCICGNQPFKPTCSFGLTWYNQCDAACGCYSCPMTSGVCKYTIDGRTSVATPPTSRASTALLKKAASNQSFPSKSSAPYSYTRGVHYLQIFYESMRSGRLSRFRLAWRGDSCLGCKGPNKEDLSGGFYEAGGSFLKLGLVEAFLATLLADTVLTFPSGYRKAGDLTNALDNIEWGADYLMKAHSASGRFVAVLGNSTQDFNYFGSVERYGQYVKSRPSCYIDKNHRGSEIAGEASAALAAATIAFKQFGRKRDTARMLVQSKQLYNLATKYQGSYQSAPAKSCLGTHKSLYPSSNGYYDELAWAAAWLYKATREQKYLNAAKSYYTQGGSNSCTKTAYSFETGNKCAALAVLMQEITSDGSYFANAQAYFNQYVQQAIPHSNRGFALPYHWGAIRPTTQMAYLALKQSKMLRNQRRNQGYAAQLFNYAQYQIDYLLGNSGRAWIGGMSGAPKYFWHKLSYNSYIDEPLRGINVYANIRQQKTDGSVLVIPYAEAAKMDMEGSRTPQRFTPYGAPYGSVMPNDQAPYGRKDYTYTEPTTDGAGGLSGALAGLAEYYTNNQKTQNDCGLDLGWNHKNAPTGNPRAVNNLKTCK